MSAIATTSTHSNNQNPTDSASDCMRADELARFLGVNRKTVYEYAARNVIPCRRLGRRLVFLRTAITAWLARQSGAVVVGGIP